MNIGNRVLRWSGSRLIQIIAVLVLFFLCFGACKSKKATGTSFVPIGCDFIEKDIYPGNDEGMEDGFAGL